MGQIRQERVGKIETKIKMPDNNNSSWSPKGNNEPGGVGRCL